METKYGYSAADWGKIRTLQFGILSPEQIRAMSAVQIVYPEAYEHGQPKMGGLNDPRMGTVDKSLDCSTCASTMVQCPGHFGHLELAKPMFHVGFLKTVLSVLRCICINCSAILADEVVSIKVIRNKVTGYPEGYGFVEFVSHAAAERILQTYNGTQMPGTEQLFRLNWASFGLGERRLLTGPEHSIFVGDLAPDVTDYLLQETFRSRYPSVRGAKVVTDPSTGRSKGYGFVKFADENERNRAMTEMNGVYCSTRPMRISAATPKKSVGYQQQYTPKVAYQTPTYSVPPAQVFQPDDINNTTDQPAAWGQPQADPSQWTGAYYGYGQGYEAYGYAAPQDPSMYGYGTYPASGNYQQQTEVQELSAAGMTNTIQASEHKEEDILDPLAPPDVEKLNAAYIALHEPSLVGRNLWLKTSDLSR